MAPKSDKFIASDDDLDDFNSDSDHKPSKSKSKTKKSNDKKSKRKKDEDEDDEEEEAESTDDDEDERPSKKKTKSSAAKPKAGGGSGSGSGKMLKNGDGDQYVVLGNNKRVTVRKFKGSVLIDIRETYEKDGKEGLPGKKGISLTTELWQKLKGSMNDIDAAIEAL